MKTSQTEERIWMKEIDMYVKQNETYKSNKVALYSVVWSQCSEVMQARLKSSNGFEIMSEDSTFGIVDLQASPFIKMVEAM